MTIYENIEREQQQTAEAAKELDKAQGRDQVVINELAKLSPMEYDRVEKAKAGELGIKPKTLANAVKEAKKSIEEDGFTIDNPEPFSEHVNGAELLDDLVVTLERFLVLPKHSAETIALWILFTYVFDAVRVCPLLVITSPEKRCGKTSALSLLLKLISRGLPASNITPAALFRTIEKMKPSLLIDEADTFLKNSEELRGIINSGHTRDMAFTMRLVGDNHDTKQFSTWGPKAIAVIGNLKDTLLDRSIIIAMRRKKPGENVERLRKFDSGELKAKCVRWAADNMALMENIDPEIPESLHDRAADNWEPLLSIAELAGGHWPDIARMAATELNVADLDGDSIKVQLLDDLRTIFDKRGDKAFTDDVVHDLNEKEERPWGEWKNGKGMTPRQLANLLKGFGVKSKDVRINETVKRGYRLEDFEDCFARYLSQSATTLQTSNSNTFSDSGSATEKNDVAHEKPLKPAPDKGCSTVAHNPTHKGWRV